MFDLNTLYEFKVYFILYSNHNQLKQLPGENLCPSPRSKTTPPPFATNRGRCRSKPVGHLSRVNRRCDISSSRLGGGCGAAVVVAPSGEAAGARCCPHLIWVKDGLGGMLSTVVRSVHSTVLSIVALLPWYWWVCNAIAISLANVLLQLRWSAIRRAAI
jgi:hypothetical protein